MLKTREELRGAIPRGYSFVRHVALIHASSLAVIAVALALVRDLRPVELLVAPLGFLFANLVEYAAHRVPMHRSTPPLEILFRRHTLNHHAFFRAESMRVESTADLWIVLFPSWAIGLLLPVAAPFAGVLFLTMGANVALLFFATAVAYYLLYEWLHASYHLFGPQRLAGIPLVGRAAERHALHHDPARMNEGNFNITFPLFDTLFGTKLSR